MVCYFFCNQTIKSTVPLPELPFSANRTLGQSFNLEGSRHQREEYSWQHHWYMPSGEIALSYGTCNNSHLLRFPSLADFLISPSANHITCYPAPETNLDTVRHLLLDQVLPRCLAHQGMVMLHASAVRLLEGVVLFIGPSGEGKSTLAGYFHTSGEQALSDDCVQIMEDQVVVKAVPSYGGLRLWQDTSHFLFPSQIDSVQMASYSSKQRLKISDSERLVQSEVDLNGYPILAVIVLSADWTSEKSRKIELVELSRSRAFIEVMRQTFFLDISDRARYSLLVRTLGRMVPKIKVFNLSLPHDYECLPAVRQSILDAVTNLA
jgi:hypothetical protein